MQHLITVILVVALLIVAARKYNVDPLQLIKLLIELIRLNQIL